MNGKQYLKNKLPMLVLNLICMMALSAFLLLSGNSVDSISLILFVWLLVLAGSQALAYNSRKKQMEKLLRLTEQLDEQYLIAELMSLPEQADDQVFYQILKLAEKSMLERIGTIQRERLEYKEYIEQWIHEVKTPITAMKLLCENNRSAFTRELLAELEKTNRFIDQALYYARSEHTEKDYLVREIRLFDAVHQAISDNKYLLQQNGVQIDVQETDETVYSDEKWICFILNQLIVNAVKYQNEQLHLTIYSEHMGDQIILCVRDNGVGISSSDLPRIFEKGFTGKNGRTAAQNATGIGLYLCKKLCDKLGIGISATSGDEGTTLRLSFYINNFIHQVQG